MTMDMAMNQTSVPPTFSSHLFPFPLLSFSISLLLTVIFLSQKSLFAKNKNEKSLFLAPGPKPWPLVGSLPELLHNKPTFRWIDRLMNEMNSEIICIRLGTTHVFVVRSPELGCEFLRKQDARFASRPLCLNADITSNGYLSTALVPLGEQWKKMRRILVSDLLSTARHRWLHQKRLEEADHLVRVVFNQCMSHTMGGMVNVRSTGRHYCGNLIRRMIFNKRFFGKGKENGEPGVEEEEHVSSLFTILKYLYSFAVSDYVPFLRGLIDIDGNERITRKAVTTVSKYHDPEIDRRIQQWQDGSRKEKDDYLDILITLQDNDGKPLLTAEEIKGQIVELMIATVDNPSNCIEWALAEMINQPKILEKATEELDRVVGKDRLVQEYDLKELNYLKACLREALRLHPIAPFNVPHLAISDATVAGYFIPKGSHVLLSRPGLGRNPRVWDKPLMFTPERHMNTGDGSEVLLSDPGLNLFSFSTGRRGCAGVQLGSTITTMLLARLLQGFSWAKPPNVSSIDLSESEDELFLSKPLFALAKPRLDPNLYAVE